MYERSFGDTAQILLTITAVYFVVLVAVQTNMVPPKKMQPGMLQSSLVHASVATMQNPMGCSVPRLSISSRPASMVASMEAVADGSAPFAMMKLKTVMAVFVVVVAYLVAGGLVFRALEQPFENNQKITITAEKAAFLQKHPCVSPEELEALIKVRLVRMWSQTGLRSTGTGADIDPIRSKLHTQDHTETPADCLTHTQTCLEGSIHLTRTSWAHISDVQILTKSYN